MAEESRFWNDDAEDGGPYSAEDFAEFIRAITFLDAYPDDMGVLIDYLNELEVTRENIDSTHDKFHVKSGAGIVHGTIYMNDSEYISDSTLVPATGTQYVAVYLEKDNTAQTVRIKVAVSTSPISMINSSNIWQLLLASYVKTSGTYTQENDERVFCIFNSPFTGY